MQRKSKAIVLSTLRYKENDLIVKCYTNERGVVSYLQKGVLKSKRSKTRAVFFQPLMLLEIEENYTPGRSLQFLKEVGSYIPLKSLHTNVLKASLSVFIAEVLSTVLKEEEADLELFTFIETTIQFLDVSGNFANFHLLFLLRLTKHLGFYPDNTKDDYPYFNLESGSFEVEKSSLYAIEGQLKIQFKQLLDSDFSTVDQIKLNITERRDLLKTLLVYFELHLGNFKKPKSLQVFIDVFQ